IQVTIVVMAQALIEGRIDCRTAGRLAVGLQTASKLLWMIHCKRREESKGKRIQPQICADGRGLRSQTEVTAREAQEQKGVAESRNEQVVDVVAGGDRAMAGSTARSAEALRTRIMAADTAKAAAVIAIRGLASPRIGTQQATGPPEWLRAA